MSNYNNGKIYKIVCLITGEVYYGSTVSTLSSRLAKHKYDRSCMCRQILCRGSFRIELIKDFPCNSKRELEKEEGVYIRNNECINKNLPQGTAKEYYQRNKERYCTNQKNYRKNHIEQVRQRHQKYENENKEKIQQRKREKVTCECGAVVCRGDISTHKKSNKHIKYLQTINFVSNR